MKLLSLLFVGLLFVSSCKQQVEDGFLTRKSEHTEVLPSWNDGELKKAIIEYVENISNESHPDFIPEEFRIATFDNDGTLWSEKPYVQELFINYRLKNMLAKNPELAKKQPFKAAAEGDKTYFNNEKKILELLVATHTGIAYKEFSEEVKKFVDQTQHPKLKVPIIETTYKPQRELLDYLRSKGFKTYIVTGGSVEFVRVVSEDLYGIPPEQVVGSSFKYEYQPETKKIFLKPEINHWNDKEGKPVAIELMIGKTPVFACGNEGGRGDIAMLEFSQSSPYKSFQLLVNHDDDKREFFYQEVDSLSLKKAKENEWHVISVKKDWKKIY